jgi:uncharacterized protein (TIGR02231 family)
MSDLAPIKEVTVYADCALVTRRGSIHLNAGEHELRINNLPQFFRDSLRASGQGPQGMRILNVDITTAFYSRAPEAELQTIQNELEQLQQKQYLLQAKQNALQERRQWLHTLGEQSRDFAKGLAQGQMKPQDCADFFSFMADQSLQDAQASLELEKQIRQVQSEIEAKQRELNAKQGTISTDRLAAAITLELPTDGEVILEISYRVGKASWYPQYDVRVQMNDEQSQGEVELTYLGMVQQATGERWENVTLALSTARPSLAAVLPELKPWYLKDYTPPPPPPMPYAAPQVASMPGFGAMRTMTQKTAPNNQLGEDTFGSLAAVAPPPPPVAAEIATATVERTGTALVFRIGHGVDIPSDNSSHKTTIARDHLPCEFDYVSAPILEENAHLRATVTNTTERVLLKGDASIFLSNEYVGTTKVKMTAPNEQFQIFLGIDDAIKIKRELIERAVDKGNLLQNDLRRSTYAYLITVHNYADAPRKIVIQDHLPVSQHERIKVKILQIQPQPAEHTKLEILTWKFTLPADGEQKIEYRFIVEHPQGLKVIGLP